MVGKKVSRGEKIIENKKFKARKLSIYEAGAFSVSDGFGLRNIAPYALALNAPNSMIGLLTSIPSLLGNLSQLSTHYLIKRFKRKNIVIFSVFFQTLFWLLLLIPGLLFLRSFSESSIPIILFISLYSGLIISGSFGSPAWISWMKDLVPENKLGIYFAKRNKFAGTIAFISMIIAGFILDHFNKIQVIYGFLILIFISFMFRGISGILITKQYEPKFKEKKGSYFSLGQFLTNMPYNNFGRFVLFLALMNFSIAIASPFFAVYLLRQRELSYTLYMAFIMFTPLMGILTMTRWGKFSDNFGNTKILRIVGFCIAIIPFFYFVSSFVTNFIGFLVILVFIGLFAGMSWAGFQLSVSNFLFKSVSREKMVLCSAYMNLASGFSIFLGATLGGFIASINYWNPILIVFLISGFGRLAVYFSLIPKIKEKPEGEQREYKPDMITNLVFAPRFFNPMWGVNVAIKTSRNIKLIGKAKFF